MTYFDHANLEVDTVQIKGDDFFCFIVFFLDLFLLFSLGQFSVLFAAFCSQNL